VLCASSRPMRPVWPRPVPASPVANGACLPMARGHDDPILAPEITISTGPALCAAGGGTFPRFNGQAHVCTGWARAASIPPHTIIHTLFSLPPRMRRKDPRTWHHANHFDPARPCRRRRCDPHGVGDIAGCNRGYRRRNDQRRSPVGPSSEEAMRARAFAVAALSLLLASCVDSERLRSNLGGPEMNAAEARESTPGLTSTTERTGRDASR
jgi:hypothetical protein